VTASFGFSTSIYQNTIAVGGHQALSVQVFTKNGSNAFSHLQTIPCPGGTNCLASYAFGYSLALGSKCLVVGTPGAQLVNIFTITSTSGGMYVLSESLFGQNIASDFFGFSLSLADGKALAVGAYQDSHVYVYSVSSANVFTQQQVLFSPQVNGVGFGYSLSFSGDAMALVVGQFVVENGQSGQAIVFTTPSSPSTSTLQLSYTQSQDISAALSVCYPGAFGAAIVADPVGHEDFAVGSPKINTINLFTSSMPSSQPTGQPTGSPFPPLPTSHPTAMPSRYVTHKPTKAPALPSSASGASSSSSGALSDGGIAGIVILVLFLFFALCAQTYYYNYVYIHDEHLLSSSSSTAPASYPPDPPVAAATAAAGGGGSGSGSGGSGGNDAVDANGIELGKAVTTTTPQKQQRSSMFSFPPSPSPRRGTQAQSPAALRRGTGIGGFEIDYRSMLLRFLDCFSPDEIPNIDLILSGFRTREEDLLDDLYALYGTHPRMFTIRAMVKRFHAIKPLKDANGVAPKFDEMLNAFRGRDEVLLVFLGENFGVSLGDLFSVLVSDRVPPPSSLTERSM